MNNGGDTMYGEMASTLRSEVKARREAKQMSLSDLAKASHVPFADMHAFESNSRMMRSDELMRISTALDMPLKRLFGA